MLLIFVINNHFEYEQSETNRINKEEIMSRKSLKIPDAFYYICGKFTTIKSRLSITDFIKKVHHTYFGVKLGEQDKTYDPHIASSNCKSAL